MSETTGKSIEELRQYLESTMKEISHTLKPAIPDGVGYTLFLFNFGEHGAAAYMSTADRPYMIKYLKEWLSSFDPLDGKRIGALEAMRKLANDTGKTVEMVVAVAPGENDDRPTPIKEFRDASRGGDPNAN